MNTFKLKKKILRGEFNSVVKYMEGRINSYISSKFQEKRIVRLEENKYLKI